MKVLIPGHAYDLKRLKSYGHIRFSFYMDPEHNDGIPGSGTNCQEVIRMLIDRVEFLDKQKPYDGNQEILRHLRLALAHFEARALIRKVEKGLRIEQLSTGEDGHIVLTV